MKKLLLLVSALLVYTGDSFCSPVYSGDEGMPSWFYVPTGVIGVSDMYLDEEDALNQAIGRALFMQAVSEKLEIASVYELYYHFENGRKNCVDDQKSHCFAEFKADLVDYDYDVLDVYYTEYEEAVVLLNVYHGNDDGVQKNATFSGSYMFYFDGTIRYPEFGDMLNLSEDWLSHHRHSSSYIDQDILNSVFIDSIRRINRKFNRHTNLYDDDLSGSIIHPIWQKPWEQFENSEPVKIYWDMYLRSAWGENITPHELIEKLGIISGDMKNRMHHSFKQCLRRVVAGIWRKTLHTVWQL